MAVMKTLKDDDAEDRKSEERAEEEEEEEEGELRYFHLQGDTGGRHLVEGDVDHELNRERHFYPSRVGWHIIKEIGSHEQRVIGCCESAAASAW
ncbi:unnamed protein product [Hydatigera taeniaeformis]|uniref:Uncharacterized protein n=1 Tax=Hydatigena taeniaeformis TaxID=6205 RepID=A0A0R3X6N4_HYDTA|nr:unnamed protein product [Hydatigera taeniaeformis]